MTTPTHILDIIEEKYNMTNAEQIKIAAAHFGYALAAQQLEEKEKEIERLKGLAETIQRQLLYQKYKDHVYALEKVESAWQQFKTDNNL